MLEWRDYFGGHLVLDEPSRKRRRKDGVIQAATVSILVVAFLFFLCMDGHGRWVPNKN